MIVNFIKSSISWLLSQVAVSIIVWIIYLIFLQDLIVDIYLFQWIGIVLIVSLVFPAGRPTRRDDATVSSKKKLSVLSDLIPNGRQGN
jgi:hypothetical protein